MEDCQTVAASEPLQSAQLNFPSLAADPSRQAPEAGRTWLQNIVMFLLLKNTHDDIMFKTKTLQNTNQARHPYFAQKALHT